MRFYPIAIDTKFMVCRDDCFGSCNVLHEKLSCTLVNLNGVLIVGAEGEPIKGASLLVSMRCPNILATDFGLCPKTPDMVDGEFAANLNGIDQSKKIK